jgi:hypothetical protein
MCVPILLLALGAPLRAELLKLSLLDRPTHKFMLKLDIFKGSDPADLENSPRPGAMGPAQEENLQKSIAEEIQQSITFEGFIVKNGRKLALLNVSGEFFAVGEGEIVLEKIKILEISRDKVIIEYDGLPYDIRIKGE